MSGDLLERAGELGIDTLDTAPNYSHYQGHKLLRDVGASEQFKINTKVGYFLDRDSRRTYHSLDPQLVSSAVASYGEQLGRQPHTVFLHNLDDFVRSEGVDDALPLFVELFNLLENCTKLGMMAHWGISIWSCDSIIDVARRACEYAPDPHAIMVRSGLLVSGKHIAKCGSLFNLYPSARRIGMSPFRGNEFRDAILEAPSDLIIEEKSTPYQRTLRLAFELPAVHDVALSVTNKAQLQELYRAAWLKVNDEMLRRYVRRVQAMREAEN